MDSLNEFLNNAVELHDVIAVSQILKDHNYICEVAVEKLNELLKVQKLEHSDPDKYHPKLMHGYLHSRSNIPAVHVQWQPVQLFPLPY